MPLATMTSPKEVSAKRFDVFAPNIETCIVEICKATAQTPSPSHPSHRIAPIASLFLCSKAIDEFFGDAWYNYLINS